jgi:ABC-type glycerol-3-phosphate transport system permease component
MHQYIHEAIPHEIYESSKMDGASDWRTYWQIVLPLIRLGLAALNTLYSTDIPATMLGTTISVLPIFIAFLGGTKHFIAGLTSGSVKS